MKTNLRILAASLLVALAPVATAQVTTGTTPEQNKGQALVAGKIASNFTTLAGGEDNALALVNALRTGGDVNLVTVVPPPEGSPPGTLPTTTTTTFDPPTKPMGWGNVKHALALAQAQLTAAGIANPTAAQLQTALMGGDLVVTNADGTTTTTHVNGILTMRADGMGWGNIAKAGGTKLGPVTSQVNMSNKPAAATTTTTTTTGGVTTAAGSATVAAKAMKSTGVTTAAGASATPGSASSKGITTAAGATAAHGSKGLVTASGASANASPQGNAYGRGLVTGAGTATTSVGATMGNGSGNSGAGLVTAGGNSATAIASASGNAGGSGNGKGQGNGKGKGG
jgi:hypothetical protein